MMAKDATVREILDDGLSAASAGLDIIEQTRADQKLGDRDDDGPRMKAWLNRHARPAPPPLNNAADMGDVIQCIVDSERKGRMVTAGAALVRLRMRYENLDLPELASDEQSWLAFATKHVPLPAERVAALVGKMVHHGGTLRCTKCGTYTRSACGCGRPYVSEHRWGVPVEAMLAEAKPTEAAPEPAKETALDRAIAAVTAHPKKSNRALAAEIGVNYQTVRRARQQLTEVGVDVSADVSPDRRTGPGYRASGRKPMPTPADYFEAINGFHGELVGFLNDFSGRFSAWREDAGPLDDEGKQTLMQALYLCGDGFMRVAQELDGR